MSKSFRNQNKSMGGSSKMTGWRGTLLLGLAGLAASALVVRNKTQQAERDNPPTGKFVEVDGVRLHYIDRGEGPIVVLLHGNGVMAKDFDFSGVTDMVSEHYRVIAFDRPGYGYSQRPRDKTWTPMAQAELLHHALQKLGIDQAIVLGHSWGTLVAIAMALEFPTQVRGLVLLSGYYYPSMRLDAAVVAIPAIPVVGDVMRYTLSPLLGRMMWPALVKKVFKPVRVPERFRRMSAWMALRPSQLKASAGEAALMVPSAMTLSKRYTQLKMQVVVMAGDKDHVADAHDNSVRLHDELPNSELRLSAGVGHMVHYAAPEKVVAAIDSIMTEVQPSSVPQALSDAESIVRS